MSQEQNARLEAMLAQYEKNNTPKSVKKERTNGFSLDNYFSTYLPDGVNTGMKTIRILPTSDGSSPFVEVVVHKIKVDGKWETYPCLAKHKKEPCPLCEAKDVLLASGEKEDKESAKNYRTSMVYIVKVIDRDNEAHGVKFWRFNSSHDKSGVYDKVIAILNAIKKDITNPETGRDLLLTINRREAPKKGFVVSGIASLDPSPLSEDEATKNEWMSDEREWTAVYGVKNYDFLTIVVKGGAPIWDKEAKKFVDKYGNVTDSNEDVTPEEEEVIMTSKTIKETIKEADAVPSAASGEEEEDEDDLPF